MKKITLTKGMFAVVDDEDFELVNKFKWTASIESRNTKVYAIRRQKINGKSVKFRMHRLVMNLQPTCLGNADVVVDHINGDSLDNRKENLRIVSQKENMSYVENWRGNRITENVCL